MAKVKIDQDRCKGCFLCISFCPAKAIAKSKKLNKQGLNYAEGVSQQQLEQAQSQGCIGCLQCEIICPDWCIKVIK